MSTDVFEIRLGQNVNMAKINDIWTKNEINNNNNHKAS
jgi:hypothetical protein